jgi:probable F420-dependent oxidoreductase
MKFGISVSGAGGEVDTCLELGCSADALGYDSVWVFDHLVLPVDQRTPYPYDESGEFILPWQSELPEPLMMMSALAVATRRVRIGSGVLVMPLRHPAVTAKTLAAADLLSGGRIVLGVGVGWLREEFEALGLPALHFERRGAVTDDYIRAVKEMWTSTGPSWYRGEFVHFEQVGTFPKPLQKPHPPIVIGGKGRHALRRASLHGDGYHGMSSTPDELAAEVAMLREIATLDRRDPAEIEILLSQPVSLCEQPLDGERAPLMGSVEQVAEDLIAYGKAGLQHLVGTPMWLGAGPLPVERARAGIEVFAREILPAFSTGRAL